VAAGQPLARLDRERTQAAFDAVVAAEAAAEALLAELVAGPRREAIERAEAAVAAARAEAALATATANRTRQALAAAAVSVDDDDRASRAATIAAATLRSAEAQLAELVTGTRPEQLAAQRAAVARLQAERRRLARDLADLELRAPFAGRVVARSIAVGQVVAAGAPAFDLVADDGWRIRVGVPMRSATRGATNLAAAAVATRGERPLAFVATNASLVDAVDPRVRTVDLLLPLAPGQELRDDELVHVAVPDGEVDGLAVPPAALRGGPRGLFRCLVATPDGDGRHVARHRDVQVGSWLGERVVVTGGLQPGDLLIVSGADHVLAGMPVRPTEVR
jgi:multidrug efflux pump subunit AcrA (membrane-fusion protein)